MTNTTYTINIVNTEDKTSEFEYFYPYDDALMIVAEYLNENIEDVESEFQVGIIKRDNQGIRIRIFEDEIVEDDDDDDINSDA